MNSSAKSKLENTLNIIAQYPQEPGKQSKSKVKKKTHFNREEQEYGAHIGYFDDDYVPNPDNPAKKISEDVKRPTVGVGRGTVFITNSSLEAQQNNQGKRDQILTLQIKQHVGCDSNEVLENDFLKKFGKVDTSEAETKLLGAEGKKLRRPTLQPYTPPSLRGSNSNSLTSSEETINFVHLKKPQSSGISIISSGSSGYEIDDEPVLNETALVSSKNEIKRESAGKRVATRVSNMYDMINGGNVVKVIEPGKPSVLESDKECKLQVDGLTSFDSKFFCASIKPNRRNVAISGFLKRDAVLAERTGLDSASNVAINGFLQSGAALAENTESDPVSNGTYNFDGNNNKHSSPESAGATSFTTGSNDLSSASRSSSGMSVTSGLDVVSYFSNPVSHENCYLSTNFQNVHPKRRSTESMNRSPNSFYHKTSKETTFGDFFQDGWQS